MIRESDSVSIVFFKILSVYFFDVLLVLLASRRFLVHLLNHPISVEGKTLVTEQITPHYRIVIEQIITILSDFFITEQIILELLLLSLKEKRLFRGFKHGKDIISVNYPQKNFHGTFIAPEQILFP
jgi:hypothetical protein